MQQVLQTNRLILREFTLDDTKFIIELLNSPGWLQFIGDRNVKTEEQAKNYLQNGPIKSYRENGFGLWMVTLNADQTAIGMCGILKRNYLDHPDIGFAFLPEYTGMGYAHEIVSATLVHAKNKLNIQTICAITVKDNVRSISLLEKSGLKFVKNIRIPNEPDELLLFDNGGL